MVENPVAFVNDGSSDTNRKKMNAVGGRISFKAPDFSGAQFYLRARSGTQKNRCSKPTCTSDLDTTRNIAFCS